LKAKEREQLKQDKFSEVLVSVGAFLGRHRRPAIVIAAAVAVCVVSVLWYLHARGVAQRELWDRVADAQKALAQAGPEADRKAVVNRAVDQLRRLHADAPRAPAGTYALYRVAEILYEEQRFEEAAAAYEQLLKEPRLPAGYKELVQGSLAPALEQAGKWDAALAFYQGQANEKGGAEAAEAWWSIARCLDHLDRPEEARKAREQVRALGPRTIWAERAELDMSLEKPLREQKKEPGAGKAEEKPGEALPPAGGNLPTGPTGGK
jgi:tetratricopeptide (TPR) repeat protein